MEKYKIGDIVVRVHIDQYAAGKVGYIPMPWSSRAKYQVVDVFDRFPVYEITKTAARTGTSTRVSGVNLMNEQEYAEYVKDCEHNRLMQILRS